MSTRRRTQSASTPSYTRPVDPVPVPVIVRRPDTIVGFGEACICAETATFEIRAREPPPWRSALAVGGETFMVQGEPERRDPDRLVWSLDVKKGAKASPNVRSDDLLRVKWAEEPGWQHSSE